MSILDRTVKISRRAMTLFFLIDTSTSMEGSKIGAVNDAVENVLPMISEISSENPDAEIRIAALEFSSGTRWIYDEPKPASDFVWQDVQADGLTSMGEAFQELNGRMSAGSFMNGPCYAPVIILLSDGGPTDDYESGLDELKKNKWYRHAIKVAIAIGEDGKFYGWGSNRFGQYEATETVLNNPNLEPVPDAVRNGELDVAHIKKVTCGFQASAILMDDGTLYIWGNKQAYANMDRLIGRTDIVDVDFTLSYVVALDRKQTSVYTGTKGLYARVVSQIGEINAKKMSEFLDGRKINEVRATTTSVCLLLDDGTIALTGDFQSDSIAVPELEEGERFIDIEAGNYHYTGLTNLGHVYSFGGDHYRQAEAPTVNGAKKIFAGAFQSYAVDENGKLLNKWGLRGYLFGTDDRGANIAERVIAGGRVTMTVGAVAVIIEIIIGITIGLLAGFAGGWVDIFLMRVAEVFSSIPLYPFMLILSSLLAQVSLTTDQRLYMIMVILGVLGWPGFAYITRAQVLVARESEYVTAAQAMGVKTGRI